MSGKPLTKERRAEIVKYARNPYAGDAVRDLLMDSQYWREIVREADVCGEIGVPCPWCECRSYDQNVEAVHSEACPWKAAQ